MKKRNEPARLDVAYVALSKLRPDSHNPRRHSKAQIGQIARSIEAFGFVVPILIDKHNAIVAGHGRYLAAETLKIAEVPTIKLETLSGSQIKALRIADNRLTETSSWDDRILAQTLQDLAQTELDFSLDVTGFSMPEIDLRIQGLSVSGTESDPADDITEIVRGEPVTKPGDMWQLGPHKILFANSLDPKSYDVLLGDDRAAMIFTDPPYNVRIDGHAGGKGAIRHREFAMATGEMSSIEFKSFLRRCCTLMAEHSVDGALHFICMDWRHASELLEAGATAYSELKNICVWVKDNGGMGSLYRSAHEFIYVFKRGKGKHRNNVELGRHGRNRTNVWHYPGANSFSRNGSEGNLLAVHPTVKPVAMIADALLDCSGRDEIVLDPFLGSGSTLIAAQRVGRICYGIELDPLYVDAAIRRWGKYSGGFATRAGSGKRFADLDRHHGE
jgi:DNA modification methylase